MHTNCNECRVAKRVCWPCLEFFSKYFSIGRSIEPPGVAQDVWPSVCRKSDNDDIIQLFYCLLTMAESWSTHDHHCHKAKKHFTTPGII